MLISSTEDLVQESWHKPPPYWLEGAQCARSRLKYGLSNTGFPWPLSEMSLKSNTTIASKKLNLQVWYPEYFFQNQRLINFKWIGLLKKKKSPNPIFCFFCRLGLCSKARQAILTVRPLRTSDFLFHLSPSVETLRTRILHFLNHRLSGTTLCIRCLEPC